MFLTGESAAVLELFFSGPSTLSLRSFSKFLPDSPGLQETQMKSWQGDW